MIKVEISATLYGILAPDCGPKTSKNQSFDLICPLISVKLALSDIGYLLCGHRLSLQFTMFCRATAYDGL